VTEKNGEMVALRVVNGEEESLIITSDGTVIRINVEDIGIYGRSAMGVRLINVRDDNFVSSVAILRDADEEEEESESDIDD